LKSFYAIFFLPYATADLLTSGDYDRMALNASQNVVAAIVEIGYIQSPREILVEAASSRGI